LTEPIIATKQVVENIFDGAAEDYDQKGPSLFRQIGVRLVEWMNIPAGARVLDVATGAGANLVPAAGRVGPGGQVIGVDLSNEMLGQANRAARASSLTNFELGRMDAEALEFPDQVFDAVTCGMALFFFPDMQAALREMRRVCKPGGQIGVTMWGKAPFDPAWKLFAEMARKKQVEVRMPHKVAYSPDEVASLLTTAGWVDVGLESETLDSVYPTEADWWAFQMTTGSRAAVSRMPKDMRDQFIEEYLATLRPLFQADGLHLPAPVIYARARNK
jgi:ubiquinone/menaquinone biosynthesis C-methylase UbiE